MKIIIYIFLFTSLIARSQSNKYGGIYSIGDSPEKRGGTLYLYPNSDSTFLFYLELGRGAPSYNSGAMVGELEFSNPNKVDYKKKDTVFSINCEISITFLKKSLTLTSADESDQCGFGYGVYPDGVYKRTSRRKPKYFIDRLGKKTYFVDLDIQNWSE